MRPATPHLSIYIDRSPADVFAYVLDLPRTLEWRPRMSRVGWIGDGEPGVGSEFQVSAKALGYTFKFRLEVTEWDPPHYFAYSGKQGPAIVDSFMEWRADGDGCRFSEGGSPRGNNWLMRTLEPLFFSSLVRQNIADLERLKEIMEAGHDRVSSS